MKIRMLRTLIFNHNVKGSRFHKGRCYLAEHATNQPDWKLMGKIFVSKRENPTQSVLLVAGDYEIVTE